MHVTLNIYYTDHNKEGQVRKKNFWRIAEESVRLSLLSVFLLREYKTRIQFKNTENIFLFLQPALSL